MDSIQTAPHKEKNLIVRGMSVALVVWLLVWGVCGGFAFAHDHGGEGSGLGSFHAEHLGLHGESHFVSSHGPLSSQGCCGTVFCKKGGRPACHLPSNSVRGTVLAVTKPVSFGLLPQGYVVLRIIALRGHALSTPIFLLNQSFLC